MILVRHGQSHFNAVFSVTRVDPGLVDPGLTEDGINQIRAAAHSLRQHDISRILTSPYSRTLETTTILLEQLSVPVLIEPLVRERSYFSCDIGTPRSILERRWPAFDFSHVEECWWSDPEESVSALQLRCTRFQETMGEIDDWHRVLVVSHYAFIQGLTGEAIPNGAVLRFDPTNGSSGEVVSPGQA